MKPTSQWIKDLFSLDITNIKQQRRRNLNTLLWGALFLSAFLSILYTVISLAMPDLYQKWGGDILLYTNLTVLPVLALLILLNRRGFSLLAGIFFIIVLIVGLFCADTPANILFGRSFVYLTIPLVACALIIHPAAGYVIAALVSITVPAAAALLGVDTPRITPLLGLFILAFLIHQVLSRMERLLKEMEQAGTLLEEQEQRFRLLTESTADLIAILADDTTIQYISPSVETVMGYRVEDILGKRILDFLHPEDIDIAIASLKAGIPAEAIGPLLVLRLRHSNGSWFTFEVEGRELRAHPAIGGTVVICRNITARLRAEAAHREAEEKFTRAFQLTPMPMTITDTAGRFHEVNQAFTDMMGYPADEVVGSTSLDLQIFPEPDLFRQVARHIQQHGSASGLEVPVRTRRGDILIGSFYGGSLDLDGQELYLTLMNDITGRLASQAALQASKEDYFRLIENLPVGIIVHREGTILMINPEGARILGGKSSQALVGACMYDFAESDTVAPVKERIRRLATGSEQVEAAQLRIIRADGMPAVIRSVALNMVYEGEPSILSMFEDITERLQAQAEITLQNERLQEVSRRLVNVQESEKRLLSAELHDEVGQTLTSLKLNLDLASRAHSPSGREDGLAKARDLSTELMEIVRNLSLDLRPAMLDDFGLFPALRWLFERFQTRTGIHVQCDNDLKDGPRFDPNIETAAYRIIQEALTNIARHTTVKQAQVTLQIDDQLIIEVSDHGAGFELRAGADQDTRTTGISAMQERARLLGGRLSVLSDQGTGTRVIATLPLKGAAE